jgi:hypothetical protein
MQILLFLLVLLGLPAMAQGNGWLSEVGMAWLVAAGVMIAAGIPFVTAAVDWVLETDELKGKIKGSWVRFIALILSMLWVLFWFQPKLLNLPALVEIPVWISWLVISAGIAIKAGGNRDGQKRIEASRAQGMVLSSLERLEPEQRGS